jgi:hypothetical protein
MLFLSHAIRLNMPLLSASSEEVKPLGQAFTANNLLIRLSSRNSLLLLMLACTTINEEWLEEPCASHINKLSQ